MFSRPHVLATLAVALAALILAAAAAAATDLSQKSGPIGCVTETSLSGQCEDGAGLVAPAALDNKPRRQERVLRRRIVGQRRHPDPRPRGRHAAADSGPTGCLSITPTASSGCTDARELHGAKDVAISPDGRNVYVAAPADDAVAVLDRHPEDGHLTQSSGDDGCVAAGSVAGCGEGRTLDTPTSLVVSPDGNNVYVGSTAERRHRGLQPRPRNRRPQPEVGAGRLCQCIRHRMRRRPGRDGRGAGARNQPRRQVLYALSPTRDAVTVYEVDEKDGS